MDRSIAFQSRTIGGVPLLLAFPPAGDAPHPMVLWFHGFGVDKEVHRKELEQLARAGFVSVLGRETQRAEHPLGRRWRASRILR